MYIVVKIIIGLLIVYLTGDVIHCGGGENIEEISSKDNPFGKGGGVITVTEERSETIIPAPKPSINPLAIGAGVIAGTMGILKKSSINPVAKAVTAVTSGVFVTSSMVIADLAMRAPVTASTSRVVKYEFSPNEENKLVKSKENLETGMEEINKQSFPNPIEWILEELNFSNLLEGVLIHIQFASFLNCMCLYFLIINLVLLKISNSKKIEV